MGLAATRSSMPVARLGIGGDSDDCGSRDSTAGRRAESLRLPDLVQASA